MLLGVKYYVIISFQRILSRYKYDNRPSLEETMRTAAIRSIILTTLVLIGACGPAAYYATVSAHDHRSSTHLLFALAWSFSGLGVATASLIILTSLTTEHFGQHSLIKHLLDRFVRAFLVTVVVFGFIAGLACSYGSWGQHTDGLRFCSVYLSALAGLVLGFCFILLVCMRDSWINGTENARVVPFRKAS